MNIYCRKNTPSFFSELKYLTSSGCSFKSITNSVYFFAEERFRDKIENRFVKWLLKELTELLGDDRTEQKEVLMKMSITKPPENSNLMNQK